MLTLESALAEESRWLANVVNLPTPTDSRAGHRTYIGPTAVDFSMLPEVSTGSGPSAPKARIPTGEADLLKRWRSQSRDYLHGHRGQPYVDPLHPNRSF